MSKLELWYPVHPFRINQHWGDNIPCVKDFGLPTQDIVSGADNNTCPVGYDKLYSHFGMTGHNGSDLMAGEQSVYAACDGIVVEKQIVPSRGLGLGILTKEKVDLNEYETHYAKIRYWHLKNFNVEVGDSIKVGDVIGTSNNTGYSSGNHLHLEVQPMDKDAGGFPILANPSGGLLIAGSISPEPFFNGFYANEQTQVIGYYEKLIQLLQTILNSIKPH